ncbi:MAG: phosphatidylinositol kinase [Candidatus Accumulibacter sp. 66-26]|nr:type II toxin-antitoxin system HipA family toxin YjjJ [Accumulibacter sp.]OJW46056.1 MAG: phosphatidylinositol kinase [Candidatus Accumulibacter sp. 66-26]
MPSHADSIRLCLRQGPMPARQLVERLGISQPTASRALSALGDEVVRIGAGRAIQYALRDPGRGLGAIPVYRIAADGTLRRLGVLTPVCPGGFVMQQEDGRTLYSDSLPWWLLDMCPQGFLGRAYAKHHAAALGLPPSLAEWSETHMLRALLAHGEDVVGNLLLGDIAREHFIDAPPPAPVDQSQYPALAEATERGDVPGSSAGGEQPKFTAYTGQHVLVKFTAADDNPIAQRWRDLLAAEHIAAQVLLAAGIPASHSRLLDIAGRRFLEVDRFDRVGPLGRRALHSLTSVEAEFVGDAQSPWPVLAARLAALGIITDEAAAGAALLYAFGALIGNTDMHHGNLSFVAEHGRPYHLAPAYDMLPMAFAPRSSGALPADLPPARLHASVEPDTWRQALALADEFVRILRSDGRFSAGWAPCAEALVWHVEDARLRIARLG